MPHVPTPAVAGEANAGGVLLRLDGVAKSYRSGVTEVRAVAGVDLEIARGQVVGLVGESGSGKTTLARSVIGLTDITEGTMTLDDQPLGERRSREQRRAVQIVFQNPEGALNPRRTVRSILAHAVRRLAGADSGGRVNQLAESVRLDVRHLRRYPHSFSGGQRQRIGIARALALEPELLICDEPVSALDVSVQAQILNLLRDLQARLGLTYLFIAHNLAVVRYVADRIAVMYLGQIVDEGPAEAVFRAPHHPYTEALLSAMPSFDPNERRERIRLRGTLPSPSSPPSGCRFHTRCHRMLGDVCVNQEPPWRESGDGNRYRCHIEPDDLRRAQEASA
jgi:peptide/nickel transport system ATP-binding protein